MLFFDEPNDRQVDVFVGTFRMCHEIPVRERLEVDPTSIPLAELLLTKLQVYELNEKDIRDTVAILSTSSSPTRTGRPSTALASQSCWRMTGVCGARSP